MRAITEEDKQAVGPPAGYKCGICQDSALSRSNGLVSYFLSSMMNADNELTPCTQSVNVPNACVLSA